MKMTQRNSRYTVSTVVGTVSLLLYFSGCVRSLRTMLQINKRGCFMEIFMC